MKALNYDGNHLELVEKEISVFEKDEALIKVKYAGICNTDLEIIKGYMNFQGTPGHEFVGVVEKASAPNLIGKRVVGEINLGCGNCEYCLQGTSRHCLHRSVLGIQNKDGAFSEYITLPLQNLHVVTEDVPDLKAVFIEPLAAACEIVEQLEILPEYQILVLGDGKLGQLISRVLSLYSDKILVAGKNTNKLKLLENLGIPTILSSELKKPDHSFHLVVEATGNWEGWIQAVEFVRPRGYLVLKSTYHGENKFNPAALVINEITLIGSRCGPFSNARHLLRKGAVDPTDLISEVVPFADWQKAFELAKQPKMLKVVLAF